MYMYALVHVHTHMVGGGVWSALRIPAQNLLYSRELKYIQIINMSYKQQVMVETNQHTGVSSG